MKALTVYQPWATLIAQGWKKYEFRRWEAYKSIQGQRIAIHAASRPVRMREISDIMSRVDDEKSFLDPACLSYLQHMPIRAYPRSCLVATAILGTPLPPEALAEMCNDSDRAAHYQWAWPLTDIRRLPDIPHRGAQGFWNVAPSIAEDIHGA